MIYTVGKPEIYEPYLEKDENPRKLGRDSTDYIGGSVWKKYEDVSKYLRESKQENEFSIYGVLANWDTQTEPSENCWNNLLVSSRLVKLDYDKRGIL